jgi:hypothetical protein
MLGASEKSNNDLNSHALYCHISSQAQYGTRAKPLILPREEKGE